MVVQKFKTHNFFVLRTEVKCVGKRKHLLNFRAGAYLVEIFARNLKCGAFDFRSDSKKTFLALRLSN
jgi:hypothetical protein